MKRTISYNELNDVQSRSIKPPLEGHMRPSFIQCGVGLGYLTKRLLLRSQFYLFFNSLNVFSHPEWRLIVGVTELPSHTPGDKYSLFPGVEFCSSAKY